MILYSEEGKMFDFKTVWTCKSCHGSHYDQIIDELSVPLQIGDEEFPYKFNCPTTGDTIYYTQEQYDNLDSGDDDIFVKE